MGKREEEFLVVALKKISFHITNKLKFAIINLQFAMLLASCANVVAPEGGLKDNEAPKIVKAAPANASTNVSTNNFRIIFNEFIKLKEQDIIVSPPLNKEPKIKQKGKYIDVKWTDTLKPNTTYTFNFGENIVDYTEGNPYSNFKYVFSTGNVIDTLELQGIVTDAITGKGLEKIAVMLYTENDDSVVCKQKPYYFTKSDVSGSFHFSYLKEGRYKIFALKDENFNLLFDLANEKIAYSDTLITISKKNRSVNLSLFENYSIKKQKLKAITRTDVFSYVVRFDKKLNTAFTEENTDSNSFVKIVSGDSILFYSKQKPTQDSILIEIPKAEIDTILKVEAKYDSTMMKRSRLFVVANFQTSNSLNDKRKLSESSTKSVKPTINNVLNYGSNLVLNFSHPIATENLPTQFILIEDTGKLKTFAKVEAYDNKAFQLHAKIIYPFKEDHTYELIGRKNQFTDVCNLQCDSFHIKFVYAAQKHFGNIFIQLSDSNFHQNYYAELLNSAKQIVAKENVKRNHISWKNLVPGTYTVRILVDENADTEWNTGNYFKHHQPEKYLFYPNEVIVKPNWDNELEWKLKLSDIKKI
ncbi:MAG: hypothetical protein RIQ33_1140 [Bacteroidota bacterium]